MSNNVFNLASRVRPEFTPLEKTALGDIAMDFRSKGLTARLFISPVSQTALAKFFNFMTGDEYLFVTKHRSDGVIQYKVSTPNSYGDCLNFEHVLIACRTHIESLHSGSPVIGNVASLQALNKN